ncbi:class I SAM-dependent methyltransferase [Dyella sp. A6]|uniref:class I SAM-dependent methyltransferase n=1 Tax=Dyella aluminiiresistens TaxID=3069105 RepID=UPI002E7680F7|nr:methyltransferase domain-containing protein [Dyella sp. A6]
MQRNVENDYINWKDWDSAAFGTYSKDERIKFISEVRRTGVLLNNETQVLEIGFGNGTFAGWIREFTQHYVGIEANQALVDRAIDSGIEAYGSATGLDTVAGEREFDLIVAFDVIEHLSLEDIITMMQTWERHLSNDGRILIRIPSGDSPFSGRIMYGDITHKTLLGTTALRQLAPQANLELVATYPPALPILGLGLQRAIARIMVATARKIATAIINATFHGNRHGVVTSNLIAIFKAESTHPQNLLALSSGSARRDQSTED